MKIIQLDEGAEDNAAISQVIDYLRLKCYSYLWHRKDDPSFDLPIMNIFGQDGPLLLIRDIEPGTMFDDVGVCFPFKDGYGMGGKAVWLPTTTHGLNFVVLLDPVDEGTRGVMKTLNVDRCADTFRHEFVHVVDMKRRKGERDRMKSTSNDTKAVDGRKGPNPHYFNEPLELNAYFHNLAEPILTQVRYMKQHGNDDVNGRDVLGLLDRLPLDFKTWLEKRVGALNPTLRRFWGSLRKQNKRQVIKRLFDQFNEYQRLWDSIEARG